MIIGGNPRVVYGIIAVVSADNLGSLALGGFKESCSAIKMCRHCMATKEDTQMKVCNHNYTCVTGFTKTIAVTTLTFFIM